MKFSPSNHYDRDCLMPELQDKASVMHVTSHGDVPMDEARRLAERDQIMASAMRGGSGIPCSEGYLFAEMAVPADETIPPGPWLPAGFTAWLRRFGRALLAALLSPRAPSLRP